MENQVIAEKKLQEIIENTPLNTLRRLLLKRIDVADVSFFTTKDAEEMEGYFAKENCNVRETEQSA